MNLYKVDQDISPGCSVETLLGLGHVGSEVVEDDVALDCETDLHQLPHLFEPLGEGIDIVLVVLGVKLLDYHLVKLPETPQVLGHYSTIWNDLMIKFETESESE